MTERILLPLDKVYLELRYPPSLLFQDFMGTIAHSAQAVFPGVEMGLSEVVVHEGTTDDPRMRFGPALAWFSAVEGTKFSDFLRWVRPVADRIVGEILAVEEVYRLGVRAYSLLALPSVDDGVNIFRQAVGDHHGPPLSVISGEPTGVRMELRTKGWERVQDQTFDLTVFVAPITLPNSVRERLEPDHPGSWEGGLFFDLDASLAEGQVLSVSSALDLSETIAQRLSATVNSLVDALPKVGHELRERAEGH